jgi:hypothetical protein
MADRIQERGKGWMLCLRDGTIEWNIGTVDSSTGCEMVKQRRRLTLFCTAEGFKRADTIAMQGDSGPIV